MLIYISTCVCANLSNKCSSQSRVLFRLQQHTTIDIESRAGIQTWDLRHFLYLNLRYRLRPLGHHSQSTKRIAAYSFLGVCIIKVHTWESQIRECLIGTFGDIQIQLLDYSLTQITNILQFWQAHKWCKRVGCKGRHYYRMPSKVTISRRSWRFYNVKNGCQWVGW